MTRSQLATCALLLGFISVGGCNCGGASIPISTTGTSASTTGGTPGLTSGTSGATSASTSSGGVHPNTDGGCGLRTCASVNANCGPIGDGCGGVLECGTCALPQTCGGGGKASVCGGMSGCIPRTCADAGASCGPIGDGCGNLLQCGECDAGSCGGGGEPSVCGVSTVVDGGIVGSDGGCEPLTCAAAGVDCGPIGDGCGGAVACGTCDAGVCGGGGVPGVCAEPLTSCTPTTCALLGDNCGPTADGCGNLLQCGECDAGTCGGAGQPNVCGSGLSVDAGVLQINPPVATLAVQSGTASTLQLQAVLQTSTGAQTVSANWASSRPDIASISQSGLLSASGPFGGTVTVTAGYLGQLAQAQITVVVSQTVVASDAGASTFSGTQSSGSPNAPAFIYPYDQTIIPVNLQPMAFQWLPGTGNEVFQLTLTGTYATLTALVTPANPAKPSFTFDTSVWQPFAQSNIGQTVTVSLLGASSSAIYAAPTQSLTLASSRMAGDIYYWSVSLGAILSLPAGSTTPTALTVPAGDVQSGGSQCIACHAVSPDGSKLSAELWGGGSPGTVLNLADSGSAPPALVPGTANIDWDFSTFDPTGDLLVVSHSGDLTLRSSLTGAPMPGGTSEGNLTSLGCGTGSSCTQPVWSRDGQLLVFAKGISGAFSDDWTFSASNLLISQWSAATETFTTPTTLVTYNGNGNVSDAGQANVYPTISVDDSLVAFTRSICSYASADPCAHVSSLAVLAADGGVPIELRSAEGMGDAGVDTSSRFPNFSPFKEGGYHWMAFFSMRPYGWVASNQRQIWLTAIDDNGNPSGDPSHPAFWLPGQDPTTENDKAEWATLPCVGQGQTCQGDIDCCGSSDGGLLCIYLDGGSTCEPPSGSCNFWGSSCQTSADCCSPTQCELGVCCTPLNCTQLGLGCGPTGDGCGNVIQCGTCNAPQTCGGGGTPGVCGDLACVTRTCAQQGFSCGPAGDGCGGQIDCGGCDAGTCGGNGVPGVCGSGTECQPRSCAAQGFSCGPAGDGCGNVIQCGGCDAGTCGGGGTPGVCGQPDCTPVTCAQYGYDCGEIGDGCGGLLSCGTCDAGTCGGSFEPNVCGTPTFQ